MNRGKTIALILTVIVMVLTLCACAAPDNSTPDAESSGEAPPAVSLPADESGPTEQNPANVSETISVSLTVGSQSFTALLEDNETTRAFSELLPLTLDMSELNGNEKYYYMDSSLPASAENPGQINTGDLMLYGNNCLVLFFDSFSTPYSYTRLGSVTDAAGLADALDSGTVTVAFALPE